MTWDENKALINGLWPHHEFTPEEGELFRGDLSPSIRTRLPTRSATPREITIRPGFISSGSLTSTAN